MEGSQQEIDRDALARVAGGDQTAFAMLYDRLSGPLYSLAVRMLGDAAEAEDVIQDVFLQIWRRAVNYDAKQSSVFSWAILMTRGRVTDRLRARGRRLRVVAASTDDENHQEAAADASAAPSGADIVEGTEEAERVRSIVNKLPAEQRQAIELAFFTDLTHQEIAAQLNQPLGTIKARIRRGLLKLRERIAV